jgi:hypothetical protein
LITKIRQFERPGREGALKFRVVRSAEARWQGVLPDGSGWITLGSGASRSLTGTEITLEASLAVP